MWKALPHGSIHQNSSGNNPLKRNQEWNAASLNTHLSWWGTCSIKFWNCKKLNSSSKARVQNLMKDQLLLLFSSQKQSLSTPSNMDHQIFHQIFNCWFDPVCGRHCCTVASIKTPRETTPWNAIKSGMLPV